MCCATRPFSICAKTTSSFLRNNSARPQSVQCRRGHAHRRGAGRVEPRVGTFRLFHRASKSGKQRRGLSAGDRRAADGATAGAQHRGAVCREPGRSDRHRLERTSDDPGSASRGRRRGVAGQDQRGPTLSDDHVNGSVERDWNYQAFPGFKAFNGAVFGQVSVPLYQGGAEYAEVRQAKELYTQARIQADLQREAVRANIVTDWDCSGLKATIASTKPQSGPPNRAQRRAGRSARRSAHHVDG